MLPVSQPGGGDFNEGNMKITKGQVVKIKPEWQDEGDDDTLWIAVEDEDGGRVRISPQLPAREWNPALMPNQVVLTSMLCDQ